MAPLWGRKAPSRRHCPVLAALRSGPKRCAALPRPSPLLLAAPLPLAAARGCGLRSGAAQSALWPAGPRGGRPLRRGAAPPRPRRRLRSRLPPRLAGPWPCCAPARAACPRPRPAPQVRRRPRPPPSGRGRPLGLPPPRLAPPLAPAAGGRGSRAVALVGRAGAPPRGVGSFCGWRGGAPAGAGLGVPLAAASGDGPPALAGGFSSDNDGRPATPCP